MKTKIIMFLLFTIKLVGKSHPLKDIKDFADVLNIEGGYIAQQIKEHQIWVNLATILDRPFIDGIELNEWTKNNKYYLKETSIPDYNELHNYYVHLTFIKYYIDNGHRLANKNINEKLKIVVQVHRGSSGIKYLNLFSSIFETAYPSFTKNKILKSDTKHELFSYILPNNISIHYRYGYEFNLLGDFEDADIIISISLVAGFSERFKSGDIVLPQIFMPMSLDDLVLENNRIYQVKNYAINHLQDIIKSQDTKLIDLINANYKSENIEKLNHTSRRLEVNDFPIVKSLQVNKNFNPSELPKLFELK